MVNENPQARDPAPEPKRQKTARVRNTDKLLGKRLSDFPWRQAETVPDKATGAVSKVLYCDSCRDQKRVSAFSDGAPPDSRQMNTDARKKHASSSMRQTAPKEEIAPPREAMAAFINESKDDSDKMLVQSHRGLYALLYHINWLVE